MKNELFADTIVICHHEKLLRDHRITPETYPVLNKEHGFSPNAFKQDFPEKWSNRRK